MVMISIQGIDTSLTELSDVIFKMGYMTFAKHGTKSLVTESRNSMSLISNFAN